MKRLIHRVLAYLSGHDCQDLICQLLRTHGHQTGLALLSLAKGELSRGTLYVHLARLEDLDYVRSYRVYEQRFFYLTPRGLQALARMAGREG